jgi:predicted phosphodiesterase
MPVSEQEFIRTWTKYGSGPQVAEALGLTLRSVMRRRKEIEQRQGIVLHADQGSGSKENRAFFHRHHMARADAKLYNGKIFIASDCHYHPGEPSVAHKAFVKLIKQHKPDIICLNGDVFDGATISRYPKAAWDAVRPPTVKEELEAVADRLHEIESVAGNALKVWTIGNHDLRYEARLCQAAPEYEGVQGFALRDHFPGWQHCLSMMVNDTLMVKHRYHNGIHATYNNTVKAGLHIATGHLHRLQATIWSDYRGSRFGIDSGTLAEVDGEHMSYGEDNPKNHASGFVVLTFVDGELVYPEFCYVLNGEAYFRGQKV